MQQTIHEIQNPFDAYAKRLGYCLVMFMIAGTPTSNPQFLVKLYHKGDIRTVDQNDLKVYGNPSAGEALEPTIPDSWLSDDDLKKKYTPDNWKTHQGLEIFNPPAFI